MKNKSIFSLVLIFLSLMSPALADSEFDKQFAAAQEKFNQVQKSVAQQQLPSDNNQDISSPVIGDVQSAVVPTNTLTTTLPTPKLPALPKLKNNVNLNAFPSPCAAAYLLAMGGSPVNNSACNTCTIAGSGASNKIGSVLDPTINAVIIDPNDNVVTPVEWNSLSDLQKAIIIKQNPAIELAVSSSSKQSNLLSNCFGKSATISESQSNALNYFNK